MSDNTRFLIFLVIVILGFVGLGSLITALYFNRKRNKRVREILKEEKREFKI